jgi:hypothetical protein
MSLAPAYAQVESEHELLSVRFTNYSRSGSRRGSGGWGGVVHASVEKLVFYVRRADRFPTGQEAPARRANRAA